jgi:hypothetical protein
VACLLLVIGGGVALLLPISSGVAGGPSCGNSVVLNPVILNKNVSSSDVLMSMCATLRGNRRHDALPWVTLGLLGLVTVGVLSLSARRTEWNEPSEISPG